MHPTEALFQDGALPTQLPICDHYMGVEKLVRKSLVLQQALGSIFDITFDRGGDATIGQECAHAKLAAAFISSDDNRFSHTSARIRDPSHNVWM